jgi:dipeptidyl aminopeptidase/acylaminoacyl peptidase
MLRKNIYSVLIVLLLGSCVAKPNMPTSLPPPKTPPAENTMTPRSPKPVSTLTPTLQSKFVPQCLPIADKEIALKDVSFGTILLSINIQPPQSFLMNIDTGAKYNLPVRSKKSLYGDGQVSPDGNMFAYMEVVRNAQLEYINYILWVVDAHANDLAQISFDQEKYVGLPRWLDNKRLLLYTAQTDKDGTVMVVNPFTGEQHFVANELPMLFTGKEYAPGLDWLVEYSPSLEWVAYLGHSEEPGWGPLIVRDIATKQNLWKSTGGNNGKPVWSSDGDEVAVISGGQLYLVERSGQVKAILDENLPHQVEAPAWSPDGKHIAFWNNGSLMIYDHGADQVIDVCIKNTTPTHHAPLWSSDSSQIVVDYYGDQNIYFNALVDIQRNIVYKIPEIPNTIYPTVWMNSLP